MPLKLTLVGANGGIGQPLALLLKLKLPAGSTLGLYDLVGAKGVHADLSHVNSPVAVEYGQGKLPPTPGCPELKKIAANSNIILITAGVPRKPGMTRQDLFAINAGIINDIIKTCAEVAPKAFIAIVTNPVNSTVPIAAEALKKCGVYDPKLLAGIPTLDGQRASQFLYEATGKHVWVSVVGGHSDLTIVPLFSQASSDLSTEKIEKMSERVRKAGTEVVLAKDGAGSATLSMAAAAATFTLALAEGLTGAGTPHLQAYVDAGPDVTPKYIVQTVEFGPCGIQKHLPNGPMSALEQKYFKDAETILVKDIAAGEQFQPAKL